MTKFSWCTVATRTRIKTVLFAWPTNINHESAFFIWPCFDLCHLFHYTLSAIKSLWIMNWINLFFVVVLMRSSWVLAWSSNQSQCIRNINGKNTIISAIAQKFAVFFALNCLHIHKSKAIFYLFSCLIEQS